MLRTQLKKGTVIIVQEALVAQAVWTIYRPRARVTHDNVSLRTRG